MNRKTIFFIFIFFLAALLHLYLSTSLIDKNYKIENLKQALEKVKNENRHLKYAVAQKQDLFTIEKIAREKLGMEQPDEVTYITSLAPSPETIAGKAPPLSPKLP